MNDAGSADLLSHAEMLGMHLWTLPGEHVSIKKQSTATTSGVKNQRSVVCCFHTQ